MFNRVVMFVFLGSACGSCVPRRILDIRICLSSHDNAGDLPYLLSSAL